jgi:hypothetical protein
VRENEVHFRAASGAVEGGRPGNTLHGREAEQDFFDDMAFEGRPHARPCEELLQVSHAFQMAKQPTVPNVSTRQLHQGFGGCLFQAANAPPEEGALGKIEIIPHRGLAGGERPADLGAVDDCSRQFTQHSQKTPEVLAYLHQIANRATGAVVVGEFNNLSKPIFLLQATAEKVRDTNGCLLLDSLSESVNYS